MKIYIVTAEANGVPQTFDGVWFHILGTFTDEDKADEFYWKAIRSGEWGEYAEAGDDVSNEPLDTSDWQVNLYEETVQQEVPEVPQGYRRT